MILQERSYSGKILRPSPEFHIEEDASFGIIVTPWGNRASAKKAIDAIKDFVQSSRQDSEVTSPFEKLSCLSPLANTLRIAVMLANDLIYREDNKGEYSAGVELLAFTHAEGELSFVQVGYPHLFLARRGLPWIPLSVQIDLATEMSPGPQVLSPLPQNLIGLHTTTNMNVSSLRTQPQDRLVMLSHSIVSHPLFMQPFERTTVDEISQTLSRQFPELPFWLGVFDLP